MEIPDVQPTNEQRQAWHDLLPIEVDKWIDVVFQAGVESAKAHCPAMP